MGRSMSGNNGGNLYLTRLQHQLSNMEGETISWYGVVRGGMDWGSLWRFKERWMQKDFVEFWRMEWQKALESWIWIVFQGPVAVTAKNCNPAELQLVVEMVDPSPIAIVVAADWIPWLWLQHAGDYWLPGVGAKTPYSICPPPKKQHPCHHRKRKKKQNNRYKNSITMQWWILWIIKGHNKKRVTQPGGVHPKVWRAWLKSARQESQSKLSIRVVHSSHFRLLFGSFLTVWQKNDQKVTEKEMKNEMKNGYHETPGT